MQATGAHGNRPLAYWLVVPFLLAGVRPAGAGQEVSFSSLLDEMVDRAAVARFPQPAYTCRQASSYDRRSKAPDQPGWFANNDRSFFIRSERHGDREEWVMMDAEGPGAIVRWWVTAPQYKGTIRIYLDGSDTPVIAERVDELVGGTALVGPPLSEGCARGRNLYLPIPYAQRCKVTFDRPNFQKTHKGEDLLYYQINYRTYAPGTAVRSFSMEEFKAAAARLARLQRTLLRPATVGPVGASPRQPLGRTLDPGQSLSATLSGPAAVCRLSVRLQADDLPAALRATVIKASFDGQQTVWCPVGDFFGSGVGLNPFRGWYRQIEKDGTMTCWWVMPFSESCTIALENCGQQPVQATLGPLATCPWQWDDRSMHFHVTWHQQRNIVTGRGGSKAFDWNYLAASGKGVFVGDTLAVYNRVTAWWGEGDEKIYVDGEKFPSHFGTGTEDYYGYAWCTPRFFQSPFHAQPQAEGPGNAGKVTNTRVRLLDAIPFQRSFRFDMEVWHWAATEVDYAATTYWYGRPGAAANHGPEPKELVTPAAVPFTVAGFRLLAKTGGVAQAQAMQVFGKDVWTNNDHLWWVGAKPGDRLQIAVPVERAGRYELSAVLTKAPDYGIVQLYLDDQKLGEPIDLYHTSVIRTEPVPLGTLELSAGKHRLCVEIVGANPKAIKRYMFGLDELVLKPVERK